MAVAIYMSLSIYMSLTIYKCLTIYISLIIYMSFTLSKRDFLIVCKVNIRLGINFCRVIDFQITENSKNMEKD